MKKDKNRVCAVQFCLRKVPIQAKGSMQIEIRIANS